MRKSNLSAARLLVCVENKGYRGHRKGVGSLFVPLKTRRLRGCVYSVYSVDRVYCVPLTVASPPWGEEKRRVERVREKRETRDKQEARERRDGTDACRREAGRDQVTGTSVKPS